MIGSSADYTRTNLPRELSRTISISAAENKITELVYYIQVVLKARFQAISPDYPQSWPENINYVSAQSKIATALSNLTPTQKLTYISGYYTILKGSAASEVGNFGDLETKSNELEMDILKLRRDFLFYVDEITSGTSQEEGSTDWPIGMSILKAQKKVKFQQDQAREAVDSIHSIYSAYLHAGRADYNAFIKNLPEDEVIQYDEWITLITNRRPFVVHAWKTRSDEGHTWLVPRTSVEANFRLTHLFSAITALKEEFKKLTDGISPENLNDDNSPSADSHGNDAITPWPTTYPEGSPLLTFQSAPYLLSSSAPFVSLYDAVLKVRKVKNAIQKIKFRLLETIKENFGVDIAELERKVEWTEKTTLAQARSKLAQKMNEISLAIASIKTRYDLLRGEATIPAEHPAFWGEENVIDTLPKAVEKIRFLKGLILAEKNKLQKLAVDGLLENIHFSTFDFNLDLTWPEASITSVATDPGLSLSEARAKVADMERIVSEKIAELRERYVEQLAPDTAPDWPAEITLLEALIMVVTDRPEILDKLSNIERIQAIKARYDILRGEHPGFWSHNSKDINSPTELENEDVENAQAKLWHLISLIDAAKFKFNVLTAGISPTVLETDLEISAWPEDGSLENDLLTDEDPGLTLSDALKKVRRVKLQILRLYEQYQTLKISSEPADSVSNVNPTEKPTTLMGVRAMLAQVKTVLARLKNKFAALGAINEEGTDLTAESPDWPRDINIEVAEKKVTHRWGITSSVDRSLLQRTLRKITGNGNKQMGGRWWSTDHRSRRRN